MINILQKTAKEAGEVLLRYFKKGVSVSYKTSHQNLLTEADIASQKIIQSSLLKSMAAKGFKKEEIGFIGEENLNIKGKHLFIIDPLDGTTNFASGLPYFAVSIAYIKDKNILAGVVYNPVKDEYFIAEKGQNAYKIKDKKRQKLSLKYTRLADCLVATHISSDRNLQKKQFAACQKLLPSVRQIRMMGAGVLDVCYTADNIFKLYINSHTFVWDIAAAQLIIKESGGTVVDWKGKEIDLHLKDPPKTYQIIACHPKSLPKVLKYFKK